MAVGFRIRHPVTGAVMLDITNRITRIIGTFDTGTVDGSFQVTDGVGGQAFFAVLSAVPLTTDLCGPEVNLSGNTITWRFRTPSWIQRQPALVAYGTY